MVTKRSSWLPSGLVIVYLIRSGVSRIFLRSVISCWISLS
ncbi:hypothetical protein [Aeromonas phage Akh-2]|nr:hypothetical protein [Aeromonas phage Akh-2]